MGPNTPTRRALLHQSARTAITEIELCAWLAQAAPGDAIEYHRGFLAMDRCRVGGRLQEQDATELSRVAARAWLAGEQGHAHLVQHRNGCNDFSYMIVARPRKTSS